MRINPVQNYYCSNYTSNKQAVKTKPSQHYFSSPVSGEGQMKALPGYQFYPQISFKGVHSSAAVSLAKKIPLEDRLASVLQVLTQGDVVIIDRTLSAAQKSLKEVGNSFNNIIKRLFYIEDDNLHASLAFFKNHNKEKRNF